MLPDPGGDARRPLPRSRTLRWPRPVNTATRVATRRTKSATRTSSRGSGSGPTCSRCERSWMVGYVVCWCARGVFVRARLSKPPKEPPPGCDPDSIVLTFAVAREHAGLRLDRFIQSRIPRLSRTRAQEVVRACAYRNDGTRRRPSERVRGGEVEYTIEYSISSK